MLLHIHGEGRPNHHTSGQIRHVILIVLKHETEGKQEARNEYISQSKVIHAPSPPGEKNEFSLFIISNTHNHRKLKIVSLPKRLSNCAHHYNQQREGQSTLRRRLGEVLLSHCHHNVLTEQRLGEEHPEDVIDE